MKFGRGPKLERSEPKSSTELLRESEFRMTQLVQEVKTNLTLAENSSVLELAKTAEGQAKLLKLQQAAGRFNERVIGIISAMGMSGAFEYGVAQFFDDKAQHMMEEMSLTTMGITTLSAIIGGWLVIFRSHSLEKKLKRTLNEIK